MNFIKEVKYYKMKYIIHYFTFTLVGFFLGKICYENEIKEKFNKCNSKLYWTESKLRIIISNYKKKDELYFKIVKYLKKIFYKIFNYKILSY